MAAPTRACKRSPCPPVALASRPGSPASPVLACWGGRPGSPASPVLACWGGRGMAIWPDGRGPASPRPGLGRRGKLEPICGRDPERSEGESPQAKSRVQRGTRSDDETGGEGDSKPRPQPYPSYPATSRDIPPPSEFFLFFCSRLPASSAANRQSRCQPPRGFAARN